MPGLGFGLWALHHPPPPRAAGALHPNLQPSLGSASPRVCLQARDLPQQARGGGRAQPLSRSPAATCKVPSLPAGRRWCGVAPARGPSCPRGLHARPSPSPPFPSSGPTLGPPRSVHSFIHWEPVPRGQTSRGAPGKPDGPLRGVEPGGAGTKVSGLRVAGQSGRTR